MATTPNPYQPTNQPSHSFSQPTPSNNMGVAGFVLSIVGVLFTCGALNILSLPISLVGLLWKPRGFAIAGTVISLAGTAMLALFGVVAIKSVLGIQEFADEVGKGLQTQGALGEARTTIENYRLEHDMIPDGIEGNKLIINTKDGWEQNLQYEVAGDSYLIRSGGPDKKFNTPDDLTSDVNSLDTSPPVIETGIPGVEGPVIIPPDDSSPTIPPTDE